MEGIMNIVWTNPENLELCWIAIMTLPGVTCITNLTNRSGRLKS
jgi:hypothetical protein